MSCMKGYLEEKNYETLLKFYSEYFYGILQTLKMEQFLYVSLVIFQLITFMQTTPFEHEKYFLGIFGITGIIYPILLLWALPATCFYMDLRSLTCQEDMAWLISSNTADVKLHIERKPLQCVQLSLLSGGSLYFRTMVITQGLCALCTKLHVSVIFWF